MKPILIVCLLGQRANRIPLSYPPYRSLCNGRLTFTEDPAKADVLLFSFIEDLRNSFSIISDALNKKPRLKIVVLSEEPLWDTLWSGDFTQKQCSDQKNNPAIDYTFLNHFTTKIYEFRRFPYFITTCDHYYLRYANFFKRNARIDLNTLRNIWSKAPYRQAFFAEKRIGKNYEIQLKNCHDVLGLCSYRSELAELAEPNSLRVGQGWGSFVRRQALPDWHLDKLATLDRQSFIVSALENTHQRDYITEKIFDAFAVLGVPIYFAGPQHAIHRLLPEGGYINLYGLTPADAARRIKEFMPDDSYVKAYRDSQSRLASLFSNPQEYWFERARILDLIIEELAYISG